jgi:hypothetical protein
MLLLCDTGGVLVYAQPLSNIPKLSYASRGWKATSRCMMIHCIASCNRRNGYKALITDAPSHSKARSKFRKACRASIVGASAMGCMHERHTTQQYHVSELRKLSGHWLASLSHYKLAELGPSRRSADGTSPRCH